MSNISISVLMPVYNSEKFLLETVQAVINQSYIDWELILVMMDLQIIVKKYVHSL